MSKETLLTTREAANRLGVSVQTVARWVSEEKLKPALKAPGIRGPLFFRAEDVDALKDAHLSCNQPWCECPCRQQRRTP